MATIYISPNGVGQGELVSLLKDLLTATGGSYGVDYASTSTTVLGTSANVSTGVLRAETIPAYVCSCHVAGTAFVSAVSAAVSAGYTGGLLSLFSALGSTLKSSSHSGF